MKSLSTAKPSPSYLVELLEDRIAPAGLVTFVDVDGDTVQVTSSKGTSAQLAAALDLSSGDPTMAGQLEILNVNNAAFKGADITIKVKTRAAAGDGIVNVGRVNGTGVDLGAVKIYGDLGQIVSGDADYASLGLKSLFAHSMGEQGTNTGAANLVSEVEGSIGTIKVLGNLNGAGIVADDNGDASSGNISSVWIGGSLFGGTMASTGSIVADRFLSKVYVGGNLQGGSGMYSGSIQSFAGSIGTVTVAGDLQGSSGEGSGSILAFSGRVNSVTINGGLLGGTDSYSGSIILNTLGKAKIGGGLSGGSDYGSGSIWFNNMNQTADSIWIGGSVKGGLGVQSGTIMSNAVIKSLYVGGDVAGGDADPAMQGILSGSIIFNSATKITIVGSLIGGSDADNGIISGTPTAPGASLTIKIGGDILGGTADDTGKVTYGSQGTVASATIGGDIEGADFDETGFVQIAGTLTGKLTVGGNIIGGDRANSTGHIKIGGSAKEILVKGNIFGGEANDGTDYSNSGSVVADSITKITINSLTGGVQSGGSAFTNSGAIRAAKTIGSLTVNGNLDGGAGAGGIDALITAGGNYTAGAASNFAFKSILIKGTATDANILSGYGITGSGFNGSGAVTNGDTAQIGKVTVNGSWVTSSIAAGSTTGMTAYWGSATNRLLPETAGSEIIASISSFVVKGNLTGTMGGPFNAIVAERIAKLTAGGFNATPAAGNSVTVFGPSAYNIKLVQTDVHAA